MHYRYIIMCGGSYEGWEVPKQLSKVNGETVVGRIIRMLRENGITDIAISTDNSEFEQFGLPILTHENNYGTGGMWLEGFYPTSDPVCYIFGDVVFSPEAIKTIVETETDDVEYFASAPPFPKEYPKEWAEPFAFKVANPKHFRDSINKTIEIKDQFGRPPIAWELWQVIKDTPIDHIDYTNYTVINDYTCDIDHKPDIEMYNKLLRDLWEDA